MSSTVSGPIQQIIRDARNFIFRPINKKRLKTLAKAIELGDQKKVLEKLQGHPSLLCVQDFKLKGLSPLEKAYGFTRTQDPA